VEATCDGYKNILGFVPSDPSDATTTKSLDMSSESTGTAVDLQLPIIPLAPIPLELLQTFISQFHHLSDLDTFLDLHPMEHKGSRNCCDIIPAKPGDIPNETYPYIGRSYCFQPFETTRKAYHPTINLTIQRFELFIGIIEHALRGRIIKHETNFANWLILTIRKHGLSKHILTHFSATQERGIFWNRIEAGLVREIQFRLIERALECVMRDVNELISCEIDIFTMSAEYYRQYKGNREWIERKCREKGRLLRFLMY
jgi:hypothetical protein